MVESHSEVGWRGARYWVEPGVGEWVTVKVGEKAASKLGEVVKVGAGKIEDWPESQHLGLAGELLRS